MVKMVSLKKSSADKRAEKDALGSTSVSDVPAEDEGVTVNLDHHHLMNMKVGGGMKSGHKVDFKGTGTVERSETRSTKDGDRHSATIRLDRGSLEHESEKGGDEDRTELKGELQKNYADAEKQSKSTSDK